MDYIQLKGAAFSTINENDPYKASKQIEVGNWAYAFQSLLDTDAEKRLSFFLDVLTDEECWEQTDTIHRVKLIRRTVALKMIQLQNWRGRANPLEDFQRYQIACWCCLEDDIANLFENFKQKNNIKDDDKVALRKFVKSMTRDQWFDPVVEYWSHIVGGCASELESSSKHLYEHGLNLALDKYIAYVEAVEFYWNKIKSLPEEELSEQNKNDILMKTTIRATGSNLRRYPEIFEFCVGQIIPDKYPELLKMDFAENQDFITLLTLLDILSFDQFKKIVDWLKPDEISENTYYRWLTFIEIEEYPRYYADEGVKLFMYLWQKEDFDSHRALVLRKEMIEFDHRGTLIMPFVKRGYMEPVWAILDKAYYDHIRAFLFSEKAPYIGTVLHKRGDQASLNKLFSYRTVIRGFDIPSTSRRNADLDKSPQTKRPRND